MDAITTTLAKIRACYLYERSYKKLVKSLGGIKEYGENTPITFRQIYISNGYSDTVWCLRATNTNHHYLWRHFAVDTAQAVEHMAEDKRVSDCNTVMRRYADGHATNEKCDAARAAADTAALAIDRNNPNSFVRAGANTAARAAANTCACDAAFFASSTAAWVAFYAAPSASVRVIVRAAQIRLLLDYCRGGKRPKNSAEVLKRYIAESTIKVTQMNNHAPQTDNGDER